MKTKTPDPFYKSRRWQTLRRMVLKRDGYECQLAKQRGIEFRLMHKDAQVVRVLDAQKAQGLSGIYGSGFLLSDNAAAQAAQAAQDRRIAAAFEAAERAGIPRSELTEEGAVVWKLSDRERAIVEELNRAGAET